MPDAEADRAAQILSRAAGVIGAVLLAAACGRAPELVGTAVPALPEPVTNNAVARVKLGGVPTLVSLMGVGAGLGPADIHARAWLWRRGDAGWQRLPDVPGPPGRLAGSAVGIGATVVVFGGYTVAGDGSEMSVALVHRLDPGAGRWETLAPMPVPVDDSVTLLWRERWVYLVSGWHDDGNVNLVQVYDSGEDRWFQATPFPGAPVFGHAGGIVGDRLAVCDGVKIVVHEDRGREFAAEPACYLGTIDPADPARIDWRSLPHHGGPALYRMAAAGSRSRPLVLFAGGSSNPYNYDGVGYDGRPSPPSARVFGLDLESLRWQEFGRLAVATMDHRGLLAIDGGYAIVGGMRRRQTVAADVQTFRLPIR